MTQLFTCFLYRHHGARVTLVWLKCAVVILLLLTTGIGEVWGVSVTYSLTPNQSSTGSSNTTYIETLTAFTYNNVSWKMNYWNPSNLQVKTNQSTTTSEFYLYNTSAFFGNISQVVITFSDLSLSNTSASGWYLSKGTSEVGTTSLSTSGAVQGVWNSTDKTLTFTVTGDCTYFTVWQNGKVATGTNKLALTNAIVVTYDAPTRDITWSVNGQSWNTGHGSPSTSVGQGAKVSALPTAPTTSDCDGSKVFVGWTATAIDGTTNTEPTDLFITAAGSPIITTNTTFYAVFATATPESKTVTYAITGKNTFGTPTGTAPRGSSASIAETYSTSTQMTNGNSQTVTLTDWGTTNITNITLSMKSNKESGAGKLSYSTDGGTNYTYIVGSSSAGVAYNQSDWNGSWSTTYGNVSKTVNITGVAGQTIIIKIEATAKSLYCQSYSFTYGGYTYSAYATSCAACAADPTAGDASLNGSFSLSSVGVTATDWAAGTNCSWTDYGFVWGTSSNPTVGGSGCTQVQVEDPSGSATTWDGALTGSFTVGTTYHFRAYGKNGKDDAAYQYSDDATFTPRSVTLTNSGSATGGTFSADYSYASSGMTVTLTATPNEHYSLGSWTVAKTGEASTTVTVTDNSFTMPDYNVTVSATFTEDPYRTVVFKNNGAAKFDDDGSATTFDGTNKWKQKVYVGEAPAWPTALTDGTSNDACDASSTHFYGWASNTWSGQLEDMDELDAWDDGTVYTSAPLATVTAGSGDIEYHAVWVEQSGSGSPEYRKVTSTSNITNDGRYLIVYEASSTSAIIFDGSLSTLDASPDTIKAAISSGTIASTTKLNNAEFTIDMTNLYIKSHSNQYIYRTGYDSGLQENTNTTNAALHSIYIDDSGNFVVEGTGQNPKSPYNYIVLQYNTASAGASSYGSRFRFYKGTQQAIQLYKYNPGVTNIHFLTTCCATNVAMSAGSASHGMVTFGKSSVATCGSSANVTMTITPAAGYQLTNFSVATGDGTVAPSSTSPAVVTNNNSSAAQVITLTFAENATGTYTVTPTFTAMRDRFYDYMHDNGQKYNKDGAYTVPSLNNETAASSGDCRTTHYKFMGWVVEDEINDDGSLQTGYTLITSGNSAAATNKNYYAVWAEEDTND